MSSVVQRICWRAHSPQQRGREQSDHLEDTLLTRALGGSSVRKRRGESLLHEPGGHFTLRRRKWKCQHEEDLKVNVPSKGGGGGNAGTALFKKNFCWRGRVQEYFDGMGTSVKTNKKYPLSCLVFFLSLFWNRRPDFHIRAAWKTNYQRKKRRERILQLLLVNLIFFHVSWLPWYSWSQLFLLNWDCRVPGTRPVLDRTLTAVWSRFPVR